MKYTKELIQLAARDSKSIHETCRKLGIPYVSGSIQNHISRQLKRYEIDTSHFLGQGWNKGGVALNRKSTEQILIRRESGIRQRANLLRRALLEIGREYKCKCGNEGVWLKEDLCLEVDHIDGNPLNDEADNLQFLCPNCHSQKSNRKGD